MLLLLTLKLWQMHLWFRHYDLITEGALIMIGIQVFGWCKELSITAKNTLLFSPLSLTIVRFSVRFLTNILNKNWVFLHVLARLELHLFHILLCSLNNQLLNFWCLSFDFLTSTSLFKPVSPPFCTLSRYILLHLRRLKVLLRYRTRLSQWLDTLAHKWTDKRRCWGLDS